MLKKVLFTGNYDKEYNRTKVISIGLENLGVEIIHLTFKKHNKNSRNLIKELSKDVDIIFLPSFTHKDVKYVKKNSNKPLIFDPLISRYLTKVFDFKQVNKYSPRAYKNYLKDKIAFKYANKIIADTLEHKKYYNQQFNIPNNKIEVIEIGADCSFFYPEETTQKNSEFIIGFYGGFIPLQGVKNIIAAAKILLSQPDITFRLIGNGFEFEEIKKIISKEKITNIDLQGWLKYIDLPKAINQFDICLGIFGDTPKAEMVIPNKIFHYAACKKPIITKDTPGIKELFVNNKNITLTSSQPQEIADTILKIKNNKANSDIIAEEAYRLITNNYDTKAIANKFISIAQKLILNK